MGNGEVCVNYSDGAQLILASSNGSAVTYTNPTGHRARYTEYIIHMCVTSCVCVCWFRYSRSSAIPEGVRRRLLEMPQVINKLASLDSH